jgi:hypothetical protein
MTIEELKVKPEELKEHDITPEKFLEQMNFFVNGIPYLRVERPATIGDGIFIIPKEKFEHYLVLHKIACKKGRFIKFVPSSGAASRMFKAINSVFNNHNEIDHDLLNEHSDNDNYSETLRFIDNIEKFAFFDDLKNSIRESGLSYNSLKSNDDIKTILEFILTPKGLGLTDLPKGLILFHNYPDGSRSPFEEHIAEAMHYIKDSDGKIRIHFTISKHHQKRIEQHINNFTEKINEDDIFEISFSNQKRSTDTPAVTLDNKPFRNEDGSLLFRPGGHGALIENLNELDADIVFIKNIDNVVPERLREDTYLYKKLLAGYLIEVQKNCFYYAQNLKGEVSDIGFVLEAAGFCANMFSMELPAEFRSMTLQQKAEFLREKLNRPIRVCGMVENKGEPGGGPFWVKQQDGTCSLQIVEKSQTNIKDKDQNAIIMQSTHFNPVDIVCGLSDYEGKKYDLMNFIDNNTGFISVKSKDGRELKALELPGLWNGAMADWNTVFVEVPESTFSPVKTINDLLKPDHQS